MARRLPLYLGPLLLLACTDPFDGFACTASIEPAIEVFLVDGQTGMEGLPGFALMARPFGTVRDGGYVDSLRVRGFSEDALLSVAAAGDGLAGMTSWCALAVMATGAPLA